VVFYDIPFYYWGDPLNYPEEFFAEYKERNEVGAQIVARKYFKNSYDDLEKIIKYCKKYSIELAIDLLTGYPNESIQSTKEVIGFFKKTRPRTVGINFYYRLFKSTRLAHFIDKNPLMHKKLTRLYSKGENYLRPIFYSQYTKDEIEKLILDDSLFKIPGITPGVNYQQKISS